MTISALTPPTDPGDLPAGDLPSLERIGSGNRVGPSAANRQPKALEKRTNTIVAKVNEVLTEVNDLRVDTDDLRVDVDSLVADSQGKTVGEIFMHGGTPTPPAGSEYMSLDGRALSRTTYATLFTALGGVGSPWGLPNGSEFNIPDVQGRAPIGAGSGSGLTARAVAAKGGAETHQLSVGEMPSHRHKVFTSNSTQGANGSPARASLTSTAGVAVIDDMDAQGGDQAHNNMQPFTAIGFFIRAK